MDDLSEVKRLLNALHRVNVEFWVRDNLERSIWKTNKVFWSETSEDWVVRYSGPLGDQKSHWLIESDFGFALGHYN